jgi:predicted class III extradiol MEMO1 family dioxygenase
MRPPAETGIRLTSSTARRTYSAHAIHESISDLDHEGMTVLALPSSTAAETHKKFTDYLARTKNTICGRHPIGVLLGAIAALEETENRSTTSRIKWVRYEQSSKCHSLEDSSVSYASAYVVF